MKQVFSDLSRTEVEPAVIHAEVGPSISTEVSPSILAEVGPFIIRAESGAGLDCAADLWQSVTSMRSNDNHQSGLADITNRADLAEAI